MDGILYETTLGRERQLELRQRRLERQCQLRRESEQVERRQSGGFPKLSSFSHPCTYGWEFLFSMPFFHPPNSRPISLSFSRSSTYSSVVISLFSHAISEKNLTLSIFNIACSRNGILCASEAYLLW